MARRRRRRTSLQQAQAFGLYIGGLAGIAYEIITKSQDKPALYAVLGGMLGLPSFIGRDPSDDDDDDASGAPPTRSRRPRR